MRAVSASDALKHRAEGEWTIRATSFALFVCLVFLGATLASPAGSDFVGKASAIGFERYYAGTWCDYDDARGVMANLKVTNPGLVDEGMAANFVNVQLREGTLSNAEWIQVGWTRSFDTDPAYTVMFYYEVRYHDKYEGEFVIEQGFLNTPVTIGSYHMFYIYADKTSPGLWRVWIDNTMVYTVDTTLRWTYGPYKTGQVSVQAESNDQGNVLEGSVTDMKYGYYSAKGIRWRDWTGYLVSDPEIDVDVDPDWPYHIDRVADFTDWNFYTDYTLLWETFTAFDEATTTWSLTETGGYIGTDTGLYISSPPSLTLNRVSDDNTGGVSASHYFEEDVRYHLHVSAWVRVSSGTICFLKIKDIGGQDKVYFALENGAFKWFTGSWNTVSGWTYSTNTWYHIYLEVYPESGNYYAYANGQGTWCNIYQPDGDPLSRVTFQAGWFDNYSPQVTYWVDLVTADADPDYW